MSAIERRRSSDSSRGAPAACARATNSWAASSAVERRHRPHGLARSRAALRGSWPRAASRGQRRSRSSATAAAASMTCSQLSSDDDQLAIADHVGEPGGVGHVERRRDRRGHRGRITDGRELDEVATVGRASTDVGARHLQREPRLADTARTDEGQKPLLGGEAAELARARRRARRAASATPGIVPRRFDFGGACAR